MVGHLTLPMLSAVTSLERYIQAVKALPMLSAEEEYELSCRLRDHNDLAAAKKLILSHLRYVVSIAREYMGYGLPQGDLIQEGNIGLMKAVRRFDPDRGARLASMAVHWIRAEIQEFIIRNWRLVKVATTKAQRKLFFNLRRLKQKLEPAGLAEKKRIAAKLGVKPEEVAEMEVRMSGEDLPLENEGDSENGRVFAPIGWLADSACPPETALEAKESEWCQTEGLRLGLSQLDARSRRIIEARWLNEEKSATLNELAAEFGVSYERIRQIEKKALQQLRKLMSPVYG